MLDGCSSAASTRRVGVTGVHGSSFRSGAVEGVHRPQPAEVERRRRWNVHVVGLEVELAQQQLEHLRRHPMVDLEAHRATEAAAAQLHLDRGEQVVGLLLLEGEVGVAGDAERHEARRPPCRGRASSRCAAMTCSSGTKRSPSGMTTKRGSSGGTFTRAKRRSPVSGSRTMTREVQRQVRDVRERMAGIDGERREHREDALLEHLDQVLAVVLVEVVPVGDPDARRRRAPARCWSRKIRSCCDTSSPTRSRICSSWRPAVRPSGSPLPSPPPPGPSAPATRTWKNSSRFWLKMARNFARSSSGTCGSSASASTRALKSSHESSRFR